MFFGSWRRHLYVTWRYMVYHGEKMSSPLLELSEKHTHDYTHGSFGRICGVFTLSQVELGDDFRVGSRADPVLES